jgi:hypothetical protein
MKLRHVTAAAAGVLLTFAAGCAGGDGGNKVASASSAQPAASQSSPAAADAGKKDEDRMRDFAKCMRDHGVNVPDPQPDSDGRMRIEVRGQAGDQSKMDAAQEACKRFLPNGGQPKKLEGKELDEALARARCMREHGVNVPDPDPNGGEVRIEGSPGDKSKVDEAIKACGGPPGGVVTRK